MTNDTMNIGLDDVEETLFVPLRGRIYASENYPHILYDKKALEIREKIPQKYLDTENESQYTLLASATRSMNIDNIIQEFLEENPEATIVCLGAGLESTYHRNNNNKATWFELDLMEVSTLRRNIIGEDEKDNIISYSMFDYEWIEYVKDNSPGPYLIISSGVFYYFKMDMVIDLLNNLRWLGQVDVVFDCVSKWGIKFTKRYMDQLDEDAEMYFYVDNTDEFTKKISNASLVEEINFYEKVDKNNLKLFTKISMKVSDLLHMVKLIHIKIG